VLSSSDLDRAFTTFNADIVDHVVSGLLVEMRARSARGNLDCTIRQALRQRLRTGRYDIDDLATELASSSRSLQRRLQALGTTYGDLLRETRHEMALDLLRNSTRNLQQIASEVGYDEVSSFSRAFRSWQGVSPGEWRKRGTRT
jgi:AraC-like DNA-binding protein